MRYKNKNFNQGLLNYVKKSHKNDIKVIKYEIKDDKGNNEKENFLQKALENLAKNKLNLTEDSLIFSEKKFNNSKDQINSKKNTHNSKEQSNFNQMNMLKTNYINSLHYKVNVNPFMSVSNVMDQPDAMKLNFERFFNNAKIIRKLTAHNSVKKMVGLFKNKDLSKMGV